MPKKKIPRKELLKTEDEFITFGTRVLQFILTHKIRIAFVLGGLFIMAIAFSGFRYVAVKGENRAQALMDRSLAKYRTNLDKNGPVQAYQAVQGDFEQLLDKYSGKKSAKLARLTFANICLKAGEYDRAIRLYQPARDDFESDPTLKDLVVNGLAYSFAGKKDYVSAVKYFEEVVSSPAAIMKDEALFNLGRMYAALGNIEKSREAFSKIVDEYKGSIYFSLAEEKLAG